MALVPQTLQVQIYNAFLKAFNNKVATPETCALQISNDLALAIDIYIKSQTIIVPPGQSVLAPPPAGTGTTVSPSSPAIIS